MEFAWKRFGGYYVDSRGDRRFSAFKAILQDGRSLEVHYQCDSKGWDLGGTNWRLGKGKPPRPLTELEKRDGQNPHRAQTQEELWVAYLALWQAWCHDHVALLADLRQRVIQFHQANPSADGKLYLSDRFALTPINQAHALAAILNDREQY